MRFDPPPAWPSAPAGWLPPAGWQPDAAWGPAPYGWAFFTDDAGAPLPVVRTDVPAWDPACVVIGALPAPDAFGPAPVDPSAPAAVAAVRAHRRRGMIVFGIGVAAFVAGSVSTLVVQNSAHGGVYWTGGFIFGVIMMVRGLMTYRSTRASKVKARPLSVALVAVGLLACLGTAGAALVATIDAGNMPTGVGGCWIEDSGKLRQVQCSQHHQYKVTQVTTNPDACPTTSDYYVELGSNTYGCLVAG